MGLIDNDKLERNIDDDIIEIESKDFVTGNQDLELVQLRGNSVTLHGDVCVVPFVILYRATTGLSVLVVVQNPVHVGPFFDCAFPVLQSGQRSYDQEGPLHVFNAEQVI